MKKIFVLLFLIFSGFAFANPPATFQPLLIQGAPTVCSLLNGNGSNGPGTIIGNTDNSPVRQNTVFTNTTNVANTSGPSESGITSVTMYIGMDYGSGVSKIPCKFVIYNSTTPANWSTGGVAGSITASWRGYADGSGGPSTTAATACAGGTQIVADAYSGSEGTNNHTSSIVAAGTAYRYIILCVTNSNVQSGSLIYSAQQFWAYQ